MAKVKGKPKKETTRQPNPRPSFKLSERTQDYIFIGIIYKIKEVIQI